MQDEYDDDFFLLDDDSDPPLMNRHERHAAASTKKRAPWVYDPNDGSPFIKGAITIPLPNNARRRIRHKK